LPGPELLYSSGMLKFDSVTDIQKYMKELLSHYEKEADQYGERIGLLMRLRESIERDGRAGRMSAQNWRKVGMFYVNEKDPTLGTLEILLEMLEEDKFKISRLREALLRFEDVEELNIADTSSITLYLRAGVPLRMVIEAKKLAPPGEEKKIITAV
jgi:hypothetical protein